MADYDESGDVKGPVREKPDPQAVFDELTRVKTSDMFAGASRLVDLLDYIVRQNVDNPDAKPLAKTIAEEVYRRSPGEYGDSNNIVRVDAGRLRRRLAEYYAGAGKDDPIQIHIDPGGYVPRFEVNTVAVTSSTPLSRKAHSAGHRGSKTWLVSGGLMVALLIGVAAGTSIDHFADRERNHAAFSESTGDARLEAERRAQLAKSPSSLQAVVLSDQARNLIFPMIERRQLELSLAMFRLAIERDGTYFGGYAGASQCLAALAVFLPDGPQRQLLVEEAREHVNQAEILSPANSWTQSAISWMRLVEGDVDLAKEHADIALNLAPSDGNVLDFYAMVMLSVGKFDEARAAADSRRKRTSGLGRFANKSIYGAASFHAGKYEEAIDALNSATRSGDPISAPTLMYLAASNAALGNLQVGRKLNAELRQNWPDIDPVSMLMRLYVDPAQVGELRTQLERLE